MQPGPTPTIHGPRWPTLAIGALVFALGGLVLTGWVAHSEFLVRILPDAPPMRFNTALLWLLSGGGLMALARQRLWLARAQGAAITLAAAVTASQYFLGFSVGIDNLILQDWSAVAYNPPGRMAPNTGICFILVGICLTSLALPDRSRRRSLAVCLCGSAVAALGTVTAFGYLAGHDADYGWFASGGMAIHTALAFALCGATIVSAGLPRERPWTMGGPIWLPLPVLFGLCTTAIVTWQALRLDQQKNERREANACASRLAERLTSRLQDRVQALERMAQRWSTAGRPERENWQSDAELYLRHYGDFQVIAWTSPKGRVRWLAPYRGNELVRNLDVMAEASRRRTFETARDSRQPAISPVIDLVQGGKGIVVICPLFVEGQFDGTISAAFRLPVLGADLAQPDQSRGFDVALFDDRDQLFGSRSAGGRQAGEALAQLGAMRMRVRTTPSATIGGGSALPEVVLALGLAFAALAAALTYFAQQARARQQAAEQAQIALQASEQKLRAIFDQTLQFIGLLSTQGHVLAGNRSALEFAGISEQEVAGKPFWETPWWTHSPEQQALLRDGIARAARGELVRMETTHVDKHGRLHYIDFSLKPVFDDRGQVTMLIPEGRDISDRKEAEEQLARAARLDKLTGLPNRALLLDRLQQSIARAQRSQQHRYAVMFLDFDRFKLINDSLGHEAGDELLRQIARKLHENVRAVDSISLATGGNTTARLGGDEFVVLLDELENPCDVVIVAERLVAAFGEPYKIGSHEVHSTASIGIVVGSPHYERAEELLRDADTAMYEAKRAGRACYCIFDSSMRERAQRRLQLEIDLRKAADAGQLSLVYQPILSLSTGQINGVEALLRWHHPAHGPISPGEFLPIAEESELIYHLCEWVLLAACRQMKAWIARLESAAPAFVSVNLSARQLVAPDLIAKLRLALAATGLDPRQLQLEASESALSSNQEAIVESLRRLRELGVRLAIDDYGTGCLSFASVNRFPIDMLKVDGRLLAGVETSKDVAALVHSLAVLVKNLGICLVAEGVETSRQTLALQELGCDYAQGYFFASPMPAGELEQFLTTNVAVDHETSGAMAFANGWAGQLTLASPLPPVQES